MPTRDMVQAKGDRVSVARTTIEKIFVNNDKGNVEGTALNQYVIYIFTIFRTAPMVMCAKCPFECELESDMRKHLNAHHGINDGGKYKLNIYNNIKYNLLLSFPSI